jgi:hypothetical protein
MLKKCVVIGVMFVFLLTTIPVVDANTDQFSNSMVVILGKCNTVSSNSLWIFGFKFMLNKKVTIQANGEDGEKINALILPSQVGLFFGHENILIQLDGATGLFFWGERSFLLQRSSQRVIVICKARDIWVSY